MHEPAFVRGVEREGDLGDEPDGHCGFEPTLLEQTASRSVPAIRRIAT